jgi:hypothetical protein
MKKLTKPELENDNSLLVLFAFVVTIIFQITAYKFIWGIEWSSRFLNICTIIIFSGYSLYTLSKFKFNDNVVFFYIIPGLLVYIGYFINISVNSILNLNVINQFGLLIPWATYLAIPGILKFDKLDLSYLWRYFNYFMFASVSLSIAEYFALLSGAITPQPIMTSGGPFLAGYFSMLYAIETGELHHRFYSSFLEPGTLAMFLLPAMAYAFLHGKYLFLAMYFIAMYFSDSLGGFLGVAMLMPLLVYLRFRNSKVLVLVLTSLTLFFTITFFADNLFEQYENRNNSRIEREVSTLVMLENLPGLLIKYPLGLPLTEGTEQAQRNTDYYGGTFSLGNAFNLGGITSFFGYLIILFVSLWYAITSLFRKGLSLDEETAVVSIIVLMPFIFQRTVVLDSSIFALLFAPFIIKFLQGASRMRRKLPPSQLTTLPAPKNRAAG